MNANRPVWLASVLAVVLAASPCPSAASSFPLMCQARGTSLSATPPFAYSFHALVAEGVPPYRYHWEYGDGSFADGQDPIHAYAEGGFYPVVLTLTDSDVPAQVCRDTLGLSVNIISDPPCVATANVRWGDAPLSVGFTASPGFVFDPEPYTWTWQFGDGASGATQLPTHTYASVGTFYAVATLHTGLGSYDCRATFRISAIPTHVADVGPSAGDGDLRLEPPRPNPSALLTLFAFELPRPGRVRLEILDLSGRAVATLVNGYRPGGRQIAVWQGRADAGHRIRAGLYFARIEHEGLWKSTRVVRLP